MGEEKTCKAIAYCCLDSLSECFLNTCEILSNDYSVIGKYVFIHVKNYYYINYYIN